MARVAIIGSCITRDLWPIRTDQAEPVLYVSRTSLPSLFSAPLVGFQPLAEPPPPLHAHEHRAVVEDVSKRALAMILAFRPSHVIFDFIDERFDLLSVGGTLVNDSWELHASGYRNSAAFEGGRVIPRISAASDRLWRAAVTELAGFIAATPLAEARIVLHSARWAEQVRRADGHQAPFGDVGIMEGKPADIGDHNALLARYDDWFREALPTADVIAAPPQRIADAGHRWGLSPFHYVPEYYETIWRELEAVGVPRVRSATVAPSVPAA